MRVLLLLPTSAYRAEDFLAAAGRLGAEVVVGAERRQALAGLMEDRALVVPFRRPSRAVEAIEELASRSPLDAVVPVDDLGVEVAAAAAERLGLPHNPPGAARASRDKASMRRRFEEAGVSQPPFRVIGPGDDGAAQARAVGPPVVVKPVSLSGSRGVIRADDPAGAATAARRIRGILADAGEDPDGPLLVERFIAGPEVAVEALVRRGGTEVLAVFDKPDPLEGPFFEETLYVTPSRHRREELEAVERLTAEAVVALGLREGPVHAEVRLAPGGPRVLEVAARSIGGLCARSLRFGAGISLEEVILRHALGLPTGALRREDAASGVMMIPIPRAGRLEDVGGIEEATAVPAVEGVVITIPRGEQVRPLPEGDRYLGFVFARGGTPETVEGALREAHGRLRVAITAP